ncbi:MAG: DUF4097 family beta strand repeat-containing protein [Aeromicrobium sp.]
MTSEETEVVADYDVRSPASRTLLTVVGTIVAVAVIAGLVLGASILMRDTTTSTSVIELGEAAQSVEIDAGSSDVLIVQGDPGVIRVTARVTSGLRETDFQIGRRRAPTKDQIKIVSGCQDWLNPGCGVESTLEIPEGFPVVIRTTSGDVAVREVDEAVLTIESGTGDIAGSGLRLDEFSATTTSGDISATFATQPQGFKAATTSGDISADMPDGKQTYVVSTTSTSGDVSSSIESDPDGKGFVRATSASGDITLTTR